MSTTISPDDPLFTAALNLDVWDVTASRALTINAGADVRLSFTGTTATLGVDVSSLSGYGAGYYPTIAWQIDGGAISRAQLTSGQTTVNLTPTPLTDTSHPLILWLDGQDATNNTNLWTAGLAGLKITSLVLDTGKTIAATARPALNILWMGDSIPAGAAARGVVSGGNYSVQGAGAIAFPVRYGALRGGNVVILAFPGQGLTVGIQGVPAAPSSFGYIRNGVARSWVLTYREANFIFGTNDYAASASDAAVEAALVTLLTTARTALGSACRFRVHHAPGGYKKAAIAAGVATYLAANPGDRCAFYDTESSSVAIIAAHSYDGTHPDAPAGHDALADLYHATNPALGGNATAAAIVAGTLHVSP